MLDVGEGVFRANIRHVGVVVACRNIGEETTYNKFLARQCACGNEEAQALQGAVHMIEELHAELRDVMSLFEQRRHAGISRVMEAVHQSATCTLGTCNIWAVCSLSGKVGNSFVIVRGPELHMLVDARYRSFLHCLWMLWHVTTIEAARVDAYLHDKSSGGSIKSHIQQFIESDAFVSGAETKLYYDAYAYVKNVLECSLAACAGRPPLQSNGSDRKN